MLRVCTISHSHIALRQQLFFKEVAKQGHEVLMISPGQWHNLRTQPQEDTNWRLATCRHMGEENIYTYLLLGAETLIKDFKPDWIYAQCEPGSTMALNVFNWAKELGCKQALFTWENLSLKGGLSILPEYNLVICGNPEAETLIKPYNKNTVILPQVGIHCDHFADREIEREINVGYIGRPVPEKGIGYLSLAWPTAVFIEWVPYEQLPWRYSQLQVLVAYSQDNLPYWKEQAPPYVAIEALSTCCKVVVSDTAASKYWLEGCPAVVHVPQDKIAELKEGIEKALAIKEDGREWVVERFSNSVIAKKLIEVLEHA